MCLKIFVLKTLFDVYLLQIIIIIIVISVPLDSSPSILLSLSNKKKKNEILIGENSTDLCQIIFLQIHFSITFFTIISRKNVLFIKHYVNIKYVLKI